MSKPSKTTITVTRHKITKRTRKPIVSSKSLKPFQDRLRELHFVMSNMTRSCINGITQYYSRNVPSCGVRVQVELWVKPDGEHKHRVSHAHAYRSETHKGPADEYTHMDTVPVSFTTIVGMEEAINFETDRDINREKIDKNFTKDFE